MPANIHRLFCQLLVCRLFFLGCIAVELPVRMLVPGFTVEELPVHLSNQNNLRFGPDGVLTSLGYDGKIWRIRDTDGDGLEDHAEPYWTQPTLSVPVGMAWSTHGLYVSSHGKVSLLKDTDGDGHADKEEIVTSGWPPTDVGSGGVDATSVTLDPTGNVYFGLLVADYSNAYRLRHRKDLTQEEKAWLTKENRSVEGPPDEEISLYDLNSPRGTIQKFDPRTGQRTTMATGIRVPYQLAFNGAGDLFNTDQEGETWMPNGNPLDELNYIIPGHNYGFPPPHPKWLPNLVSDPPVVGFGPQHQSTCGFVFNEPVAASPVIKVLPTIPLPVSPGQGLFGPVWWRGDAIVTGESRGKLWRVHLVRTADGYVGRETVIARFSLLVLDVAISPKGDLYVCCHSGQPDWGTGPQGEGRIFRIRYTGIEAPQPVTTWAATPTEVRIAFDRPIDPGVTNAFKDGRAQIEFGEYVRAADRFESIRPSYAVVGQQDATPRGHLTIALARWEAETTNLVLTTAPHSLAVHYALTIPGVKVPGSSVEGTPIDLDYDLTAACLAPVQSSKTWTRSAWAALPSWALSVPASSGTDSHEAALADGDWEEGRGLFVEKLKCIQCHRIRGQGATAGPDLSNLVHRNASSVLRDIRDPNATLHPDYVTYVADEKGGESHLGFLRTTTLETVGLVDVTGHEIILRRSELARLQPTGQSLMPTGLIDGLKESEIRSLLTFLLREPPIRSPMEIQRILVRAKTNATLNPSAPASPTAPLRLVLVSSPQDHGVGQHDYPAWQTNWSHWLGALSNARVETAWLWPSPDQFRQADVLVLYLWNHDWSKDRLRELTEYQARGGGLVLIHSAVIADQDPEALAEIIGLAAQPGKTGYRHTPFELRFKPGDLTEGFPESLPFLDEPYWPMIGDPKSVQVLATCDMEGQARPMIWTFEKGSARTFASIPGHYRWTLDDPYWRLLIIRAVAWCGHRSEGALMTGLNWNW